jgi:hypothetical protein
VPIAYSPYRDASQPLIQNASPALAGYLEY